MSVRILSGGIILAMMVAECSSSAVRVKYELEKKINSNNVVQVEGEVRSAIILPTRLGVTQSLRIISK